MQKRQGIPAMNLLLGILIGLSLAGVTAFAEKQFDARQEQERMLNQQERDSQSFTDYNNHHLRPNHRVRERTP